jgi:D-glutamate cyclase
MRVIFWQITRLIVTKVFIGPLTRHLLRAGLGDDFPLDVASVIGNGGDGGTPLDEIEKSWKSLAHPLTHVISIERVGPSKDGIARNAHAIEMTHYNAPLERLFQGNSWETIGIGDGGNELGMGNLPPGIITEHVRNGEKIACVVGCDYLLVCGVSNWGAQAILAALALLKPELREALTAGLTRECDLKILKDCVNNGPAVSVATWHKWPHVPTQCLAVDGLGWEVHATILDDIVSAMD